MIYKILKSSFDGISGGASRYDTIDEVLREVSYHKGWESKEQLHEAIRRWAIQAEPGSIFCTQVTAIVAVAVSKCSQTEDLCPYCGITGLDYQELGPIESGDLEQEVSCPDCGKRWVDVFTLADRRELVGRPR